MAFDLPTNDKDASIINVMLLLFVRPRQDCCTHKRQTSATFYLFHSHCTQNIRSMSCIYPPTTHHLTRLPYKLPIGIYRIYKFWLSLSNHTRSPPPLLLIYILFLIHQVPTLLPTHIIIIIGSLSLLKSVNKYEQYIIIHTLCVQLFSINSIG